MAHFFNYLIPKKDRSGIVFTLILGTLGHFFYEWSDGNAFIALFFPINESTWEHLKLLFFPFLFWTLWNYLHHKNHCASYLYYQLASVLSGMLSIIVLFYTYTGILGRHILVADILIFFIGVRVSFLVTPLIKKHFPSTPALNAAYLYWGFLTLCFFLFTCFPPNLPLFFSPAPS